MAAESTTRFVLALGIALTLLGCDKGGPRSAEQSPQQRFCSAIEGHRTRYAAVKDKPYYLDQDRDLDAIYAARGELIKQISGDGGIAEWKGSVRTLLATSGGAQFAFDLPCDATFISLSRLEVKDTDPVYQQLRRLAEKGPVTFSGQLLKYTDLGRNVGGFAEGSLTQNGSMGRPEFLISLSQAKP